MWAAYAKPIISMMLAKKKRLGKADKARPSAPSVCSKNISMRLRRKWGRRGVNTVRWSCE